MARVFFIVEPFNKSVGFIGETVDELESNVQLGKVVDMKEALPKDLYVNAISYQIKGIGTLKIAIDVAYPEDDESKIAEDRNRMAENALRDFLQSNVMRMSQRELQEKVVEREFKAIEEILQIDVRTLPIVFTANAVYIKVNPQKFTLFKQCFAPDKIECGHSYDEKGVWIETTGMYADIKVTMSILTDEFGELVQRFIWFNDIVCVQERQDSSNKVIDQLYNVVSDSKINQKVSHKIEGLKQKFTKLMSASRNS